MKEVAFGLRVGLGLGAGMAAGFGSKEPWVGIAVTMAIWALLPYTPNN